MLKREVLRDIARKKKELSELLEKHRRLEKEIAEERKKSPPRSKRS